MNATHLGLAAAFLTSVAVIPQVLKSYRSRHVRDISIWQPVLLCVGMVLWLIYGIILRDVPLIAANVFSLLCNSLLIVMKIVFKDSDNGLNDDYIGRKEIPEEEP